MVFNDTCYIFNEFTQNWSFISNDAECKEVYDQSHPQDLSCTELSPSGSPLSHHTSLQGRVRFNPRVQARGLCQGKIEDKTISLVDDPTGILFPLLDSKDGPRTYRSKTGFILFRTGRKLNSRPVDIYECERRRFEKKMLRVAKAKQNREKLYTDKRIVNETNLGKETFTRHEMDEFLRSSMRSVAANQQELSVEDILNHFKTFAKIASRTHYASRILKIHTPDNGTTFEISYNKIPTDELESFENCFLMDQRCYQGNLNLLISTLKAEPPGSLLIVSTERFTSDLGGYIGLVFTEQKQLKAFHWVVSESGQIVLTKFFKMMHDRQVYPNLIDYLKKIGVTRIIQPNP